MNVEALEIDGPRLEGRHFAQAGLQAGPLAERVQIKAPEPGVQGPGQYYRAVAQLGKLLTKTTGDRNAPLVVD